GELASYGGFLSPLHFDLFNDRVYVAETASINGTIVVLDPKFAVGTGVQLTSHQNLVVGLVNKLATTTRDTTITPTNFTTTQAPIAAANLIVTTGGAGLVRNQFPSINAFGLTAAGGAIWVGTDGNLAKLSLVTNGNDSDLTVPVAAQTGVSPGPRVRVDLTLTNTGTATVSGNALYLFSSAAFIPQVPFTVSPGQTVLMTDVFQT